MELTSDLTTVVMDHGTGGLLSQDLIQNFIAPILKEVYIGEMEDSSLLEIDSKRIAMTTDSFVVDPIIFGNGDIGKISVCGTVNDLAVSGAKPQYLTLGLVLEEGFSLKDLRTIIESIYSAAKEAGIKIVAGDTKVVEKGAVDKIFINTAGVGTINDDISYSPRNIVGGDDVIVTGHLGNHSIHILSLREGLGYELNVLSDCAPLNNIIQSIKEKYGRKIRMIRDLTRGGLGSALNEISEAMKAGIDINLDDLPIQHEVKMASDMLGINPIYLANEGNMCIFCDPSVTTELVDMLHKKSYTREARSIGKVSRDRKEKVLAKDENDKVSEVEYLYGKELARLC
ncbi:hydrogenase expression/formation protein HypE [Candidatus Dojkabacteria bacterium]|nr:hydrogenase expression/formation protein HypE [Candidatus Dojkabacteria bacterium]